eukprot:16133825-Heterocapsa_arctica.AAC.1
MQWEKERLQRKCKCGRKLSKYQDKNRTDNTDKNLLYDIKLRAKQEHHTTHDFIKGSNNVQNNELKDQRIRAV